MNIIRGSTEQNTWTIEENLFEQVMSLPDNTLTVSNKKGRSVTLSQKDVSKAWNDTGFISSRSGLLVKVIRFPWHPLN